VNDKDLKKKDNIDPEILEERKKKDKITKFVEKILNNREKIISKGFVDWNDICMSLNLTEDNLLELVEDDVDDDATVCTSADKDLGDPDIDPKTMNDESFLYPSKLKCDAGIDFEDHRTKGRSFKRMKAIKPAEDSENVNSKEPGNNDNKDQEPIKKKSRRKPQVKVKKDTEEIKTEGNDEVQTQDLPQKKKRRPPKKKEPKVENSNAKAEEGHTQVDGVNVQSDEKQKNQTEESQILEGNTEVQNGESTLKKTPKRPNNKRKKKPHVNVATEPDIKQEPVEGNKDAPEDESILVAAKEPDQVAEPTPSSKKRAKARAKQISRNKKARVKDKNLDEDSDYIASEKRERRQKKEKSKV